MITIKLDENGLPSWCVRDTACCWLACRDLVFRGRVMKADTFVAMLACKDEAKRAHAAHVANRTPPAGGAP